MADEENGERVEDKRESELDGWPWIVGGCIAIILGGIWYHLWNCYLVKGDKDGIAAIGAAGDAFGAFASLFSAFGFIGLIYTILQQQKSIKQQEKALITQEKALLAQVTEMQSGIVEAKEQTIQFKKTYELERDAKVSASYPIIIAHYSNISNKNDNSDIFTFKSSLVNFGGIAIHISNIELNFMSSDKDNISSGGFEKSNIINGCLLKTVNLDESTNIEIDFKGFSGYDLNYLALYDAVDLYISYKTILGYDATTILKFKPDREDEFFNKEGVKFVNLSFNGQVNWSDTEWDKINQASCERHEKQKL